MKKCLFCKIISNQAPSHKLWEDKDFLAFLDINPVNTGHTLLIPKKHIDDILDLEEPRYSNIFKTAKKLAKIIRIAMKSKRIGIGIEGLSVPHLHVHLIPVNKINDFDPNRAKKATQEELLEVAEKIKQKMNI